MAGPSTPAGPSVQAARPRHGPRVVGSVFAAGPRPATEPGLARARPTVRPDSRRRICMSAREIIGPSSSFYVSQRLKLHFVGGQQREAAAAPDPRRQGPRPLLGLLRRRELRGDYHVIAPDLRGHDSAWAGLDLTLPEYVLDVAQLIRVWGSPRRHHRAFDGRGRLALLHRRLPRKVRRLVAIEGMGAPPGCAGGA
jgi:hypothetical protein